MNDVLDTYATELERENEQLRKEKEAFIEELRRKSAQLMAATNRDFVLQGNRKLCAQLDKTEAKLAAAEKRCTEFERRFEADEQELKTLIQMAIDPRKPGNMALLMKHAPRFMARALKSASDDLKDAHEGHDDKLRAGMLDAWGINTYEDLHFKYLADNGKLPARKRKMGVTTHDPGRALTDWENETKKHYVADDDEPPTYRTLLDTPYQPGWLSPYNFTRRPLPFGTAALGDKPWYNNKNHIAVPYAGPSPLKEHMRDKDAVRHSWAEWTPAHEEIYQVWNQCDPIKKRKLDEYEWPETESHSDTE